MGNCPLEARSRPHPRLSPRKPSCSLSATWGRPPPKCPRPAQPGALCPSWVQGSRGTPAPLSPPGPSPGSQVVWLAAQRPGRLPQPHPAALTRPRRRPGACPCPLEKLAGSNPEPATPRPAHTIAPPPAGGITRRPPLHASPPRAAPAPGQPPGSLRVSSPPGPGEEAGPQGAARGGARRRGRPPTRPGQWKAPAAEAPSGPGGGQCRSLLPLARSRFVAGGGDC